MSRAAPMPTPKRRALYHAQNGAPILKPGQRRRLDHKKAHNVHHRSRIHLTTGGPTWRASQVPISLEPSGQKMTYSIGRRGEVVRRTGPEPERRRFLDRFRAGRRGRKG